MKVTTIKRRDFLKLLGLAGAGVALSELDILWGMPEKMVNEALRGPGIETFKNSICQLCPAGCGITTRLIDGVPVHIDGNAMHPINHGGICPHGAAGLDFLYHPDRIHEPLQRVGPKGSGQWAAVSWEKAMSIVTDRLKALRDRGTPEQLSFFVHEDRGLMSEIIQRFTESFGSPNLVTLDERQNDALPYELLLGWNAPPEYDVEHTRFLLGFGDAFLEDGVSPVRSIYAYGKMRDAEGGRGKFAFVDARHSLTAACADEFLPVRACTHGALALGIAYVLIREKYYDQEFVRKYVRGFESWVDRNGKPHRGFKHVVLENYYPERVAQITGVPAKKIVDVARDFGRIRPSVAMTGHGIEGTNGLMTALSVLMLNVLVGNIEKKGGIRVKRRTPFNTLASAVVDDKASPGLSKPALHENITGQSLRGDRVMNYCDRVLSGDTYPTDILFVYGANPAFDHPYAKRIRRVLEKIPFVVSFAPIIDDTSEYADLILPDHSGMEKWMDSGATPGINFAHASVSAPTVEPFYNTRHTGDVLIDLARQIGGGVSRSLPHESYLAALQDRFRSVFVSGEGAVISGTFEESWVEFLKKRGWQNLVYESFDEFWRVLVERGGWWDPVGEEFAPDQVIDTANGKISISLDELPLPGRTSGQESGSAEAESHDGSSKEPAPSNSGDVLLVPHYEEPEFAGEEGEYPYHLVTFGVLANRRGAGAYSPLLQEMFGYYHRIRWQSWVELNPHTAHEHHISEGDWVRVASKAGELRAPVVFNEAMEPHVVAIPFGMGHTSGGRYAKGIGVNPYEILVEMSDSSWGKPVMGATRVKIQKARRKAT